MARLTSLKVENFKKLTLAEISPEGNVTVVGGLNESGKSSLLDSISVLLQGKAFKIKEPVRKGAKKAIITGEIVSDAWDAFEDLRITRTISKAGNWSIKVTNKDGAEYKSPETMLRQLFGDPLDPSEFIRMDSKKRIEVVKKLMGLDFTELDEKREKLYDERTIVNRDVAGQKSRLDEIEVYLDVPDEIVLVADLSKELMEKQEKNTAKERQEEKFIEQHKVVFATREDIDELKKESDLIQQKIYKSEKFLFKIEQNEINIKNELDDMPIFDLTEIQTKINNAEDTNTKIRSNKKYSEDLEVYEKNKEKSEIITRAIELIDSDKSEQLESADFPVAGLSFNEDDVLYNDLPFDEKQLSSEELLKVSFAMAITSSPTLKTILIRHGAFLDKNNLKLIGQMAEDAGIHVFVEIVSGDSSETTIMIENGMIKTQENEFDDI